MKYRITWTETVSHSLDLDEEDAADLLNVGVEELPLLDLGDLDWGALADDLADHDGFEGLERDNIEIRRVEP